ncbi:hypothetical protein ACSDQ9_06060 [Aestuariimicrobium soli]|uniref:hypothetical protein n=1 Tax=Aestuariimicrobium soli TaxID=2035834 RepID=UPI003EB92002
MQSDPSSQPTPPRAPARAGDEIDGTVLRPMGMRPTGDEGERTTYRPRPAPPLAGDDAGATHLATGRSSSPGSLPPMVQAQDVPFPHAGRGRFHAPENRFVAPPEPVRRQRAGVSIKAILAWSLAVILVAVVAGAVYVRFFRVTQDDLATKLPENSASTKAKVLRGDEVVRQYLDALAKGDTDTALSLGQTTGTGSTRVIAKQAYAVSLKVAPITNIQVPQASENASLIPASYQLGNDKVNTTFRVVKQDNGSWLLDHATVTFRPVSTGVEHVPLQVNGVSIAWSNPMELFPGRYVMSTGLTFLAFPASDTLTVPHLNYDSVSDHQITPLLTPAGKQAFLSAAQRSLQLCLSRHELSPANCPFSMEATPDLVPGSPRWSLESETLSSANPALSASDQSIAQATVNLNLRLRTEYRNGGVTPAQKVPVNATVSASVTGSTAQTISVEWRIN